MRAKTRADAAFFRLQADGPEGYMSIRRRWLRVVFLMMLGGACFFGGIVNPKEIEDLLHIMNETKVEFTIPDEDDSGDSGPGGYRSLIEIENPESEMPPRASQ